MRRPFNACVLDIETTALEAVGGGFILCAVLKPLGNKSVKIFRVDRSHDELGKEKNMLTKLIAELKKYDLVIGHNLEGFDFNYIKTRAMILKVPFPQRPLIYDTYKGFKRTGYRTVLTRMGKPSGSLDMVIDLFRKKQRKTKIYPNHHWDTVWGSPPERHAAMRDLIEHCVADVLMNEELFWYVFEADYSPILKRAR